MELELGLNLSNFSQLQAVSHNAQVLFRKIHIYQRDTTFLTDESNSHQMVINRYFPFPGLCSGISRLLK
jgi:hypothetical protein